MENKEQIRQRLVNDGFSIIHEYDDPAGAVFPTHNHPGDQLLIVVRGSITVSMDQTDHTLEAGDEFFFPAGVDHAAKVGPQGCLYIDGERPTADSWQVNPIRQDRVSALIFRDGKLLLLHRIRPEREYWILIGGSVEDGETHDQALEREVLEECSLRARDYQFLFTIDNAGRDEHHYLISQFEGEPALSGPELARHGAENQYLLTWVSNEEFAAIEPFFPEAAKEKILEIWPN